MKNLLKVTMSLVAVLLISVSSFAQFQGTCTIEVVPGLEVSTNNSYDIHFVYDAYGTDDDMQVTQVLGVTANAAWKLDITSTDGADVGPNTFTRDDIEVDGVALTAVNGIPTKTKTAAEQSITLIWDLVKAENKAILATLPNDDYEIANIVYTFALQ